MTYIYHGGGTDSRGGHRDKKNGGYHYHHGEAAHQHPNGVCKYKTSISYDNHSHRKSNSDGLHFGQILFISIAILFGYFIYVTKSY